MDIKKMLNDVTSRSMDRREFLASTGAAVLALLGVTAILRSFSLRDVQRRQSGFGSGTYGGNQDNR